MSINPSETIFVFVSICTNYKFLKYYHFILFFSVPQCVFNLFKFVTPIEISYNANYV